MRATVLYGPRDIRFEERETPRILKPNTSEIVRRLASRSSDGISGDLLHDGLLGVLSAKQMGAERIIAMSRHEPRQRLAREFGATDVVTERGEEGVARIKDLTKGVGADAVLECVGTQEWPTSSSSSGTARSTPARCSTSGCRSTRSRKATARWTSAARSRHC